MYLVVGHGYGLKKNLQNFPKFVVNAFVKDFVNNIPQLTYRASSI